MSGPLRQRLFPVRRRRADGQTVPLWRAVALMSVFSMWTLAGCEAGHGNSSVIGTVAPDFTLQDAQEEDGSPPVTLTRLVESGSVVIVFHRGLHCPICTLHLLEISEHMADFTRAGVQGVAIGPDTPAEARINLDTVGPLSMPLLSDPGDKTARAFGLESASHGLQHGTFVVDRSRRIQFAGISDEPVGTVPELLDAARRAGGSH